MRSRELSHGPDRVMVARSQRIAYDPSGFLIGCWDREALQKDMVPVEDGGRKTVVLRRPDESLLDEFLADAVTIHVARHDHQWIGGRIGHDHIRLVAALRWSDIARRPEMGAVDPHPHRSD